MGDFVASFGAFIRGEEPDDEEEEARCSEEEDMPPAVEDLPAPVVDEKIWLRRSVCIGQLRPVPPLTTPLGQWNTTRRPAGCCIGL